MRVQAAGTVPFGVMQQSCSSCGRQRDPSHRFCPHCGAPERGDSTRSTASGRSAAALSARRRELDGPALTAVVIGVFAGLVASGAVVWFFLTQGDSDGTRRDSADAIAASEDDSGPQQTLSVGVESQQVLDTESSSEPADDTTTTTILAASTLGETTNQDADGDIEDGQDLGEDASCPATASVDNRSSSSTSESSLVEEWSGEGIVVKLCRSTDETLTYYGSSERGSIYLDARRTSGGFTARNGDTSYILRDGVLSVGYPSETLRYELEQTS